MAKKHARADRFVAFKGNNVRIMNEISNDDSMIIK